MPSQSFREQFAATPAGPAREKLVYQAAISQGPPKTVPITIDGPGGTKITYKVMPDFLMIDGIRVPMTGVTAQKLADHFNMQLPTAKMSLQIYDTAKRNGTAVVAKPLSGTGVTTADGKHYTGPQVVDAGVDKTEFAIEYNNNINKDPTFQNIDPNKPQLVDGHMKTILQPVNGKLGLHGLYDSNGKPIQKGDGETPHGLDHSEYAAGARLVSNEVIVTTPDGKTIKTTMDKLMSQPNLGKAVTYYKGVQRYNQGVKPIGKNEAGPPPGYAIAKFPNKDIQMKVINIATTMVVKPMWTQIPFEVEGRQYLAKLEPHYNSPKGVTVYELKGGNQPAAPTAGATPAATPSEVKTPLKMEEVKNYSPNKPDKGIIDRINDFLNQFRG